MNEDEQAIHDLVDTWLTATKAGDLDTVLNLMADDVAFMVPGQEPFGKEIFEANRLTMKELRIEGTCEIQELRILGEWAWMRNRLEVTITPPNGEPSVRSGYTLTILRKNTDGKWLLARDANLLTPKGER